MRKLKGSADSQVTQDSRSSSHHIKHKNALPPVLSSKRQTILHGQEEINTHSDLRNSRIRSERSSQHDNPLLRLSKQLRGIERQSTIVPPYQPFKTLNTKTILSPISSSCNFENSSSYFGTSRIGSLRPSRTLDMMSDYDRHIDRMNKITARETRLPFADVHYSTQHWHNKDRGGPINRKHSAGCHQTLMDRFRTRQKTMVHGEVGSGDIPLHSIQRALDYQQQVKDTLRNI